MHKIPESFEAAASSLYGINGGNPESPVWLCGLEWGGGYKQEEPEEPDFSQEDESDIQTLEPETVKKYLAGDFQGNGAGRPGGSAFYRSQIALLKAIIDGDFGKDDPYTWVDEYGFFSKNRYGFSLNAFPVSMKGRTDGSRSWIEDKVLKVGDRILSFSEWTGIPTFQEYLDWCVKQRNKVFCTFRKKYHPAVIYCGGKSEARRFFDVWADEGDQDAGNGQFEFDGTVTKMRFEYCWLNNEGFNPTLLVVGPFFGGQYGLNSYDDILECGQNIRRICDARFNDGGAWLQRDKFIPLSVG